MQATKPLFISEQISQAVRTGVDAELPVTKEYGREHGARQAWDAIDEQLIGWGCDPHQLDEDGTQTPSGETIALAIQLATALARQGSAPPTRVVPDVRGGIVFELIRPGRMETIHVHADTRIEYRRIENQKVVAREFWN